MSTFARIQSGRVAEITSSDPSGLPPTLRILYMDVSAVTPTPAVGWTFASGVFTAPVLVTTPTRLSSLEFMALLTSAEQVSVVQAAQTSAVVMLWLLKLSGASYVDLSDPQTIGGVQALVTAGLLTAGRGSQILAGTAPTVVAATPVTGS